MVELTKTCPDGHGPLEVRASVRVVDARLFCPTCRELAALVMLGPELPTAEAPPGFAAGVVGTFAIISAFLLTGAVLTIPWWMP